MKSKVWSVALAISVAFGLWLYVITVVSPNSKTTIQNIPVTFEGESWLLENRNLMITSGKNTTVDLELAGNRSDLNKLNAANITLKVDLTKVYEAGTTDVTYTIQPPSDVPSGAISTQSRNPAAIRLTVEKRLTQPVPVHVVFTGAVADGFIADTQNVLLDYSEINIKGPASVVEQVKQARIDVNLENITESINENYQFTLCDEEGNPIDVAQVTADVGEIHLELKVQRFQEVQLKINPVYGGGATEGYARYEIKPESIRVSGSDAVLADLTEIVLGTINFAELMENTTYTYPINLPEGVTNLTGITEVTVDVIFTGLSVKEFTTENIVVQNVPEGLKYELVSEVVKVTLRGPNSMINQISSEDIVVTVDLTGKEIGASTVKGNVTVKGDQYKAVGPVGVPSVSVTLQQPEAE